ncbi:MAG TPA: septum formation inhibitor Maf [Clostridiaceae bacterium]|nr:septum formation inhibitor Maf [Clostridiaceae bacterium]
MNYLENELILASASPRRKELLEQIGMKFIIIPSKVDEDKIELEGEPHEKTKTLALTKAKDVAERVKKGLVLGADTIVVIDGKIYGKPTNAQHAYEMLKSLSGRRHQVITGVALVDAASGFYLADYEKTDVYFGYIDDDEIWEYINSGEAMGKAGAYAIQGKGALFVERINGCYSNVVGLPIFLLKKMLKKFCKKEEF